MSAETTCDNPLCACDPCVCENCTCGTPKISELERRVMDVLWQEPARELTGRDVADALPNYAYTTVSTVLDRLVHKGLVRRRMEGRTIRFTTIGTRGAHTAVLMHEALAADQDPESALARFAETLSHPQVGVLLRVLQALDRKSVKSNR
jgi:predicted transcriptional regulator